MYTKVIMVCNNKGGVGKTTCTAAIADVLAREMNLPTLIIDADPQGNISGRFGYRPEMISVDNSLDTYLLNELNVKLNPKKNKSISIKYFFNDCKKYSPTGDNEIYDNMKVICAASALERIIAMYLTMPKESDGIWRKMIRAVKKLEIFEDKFQNRIKIMEIINSLNCRNTIVKFFGQPGTGKTLTLICYLKYMINHVRVGTFYINCKALFSLNEPIEIKKLIQKTSTQTINKPTIFTKNKNE